MSKYFSERDKVFVAPDGANKIHDQLPVGQYIVEFDPLKGYYLQSCNNFTVPEKIFGDVKEKANRVLKTYFARNCNTGVLLSGDKGSGKTMFARMLSTEALKQGISTIIIDQCYDISLNKFLSDIDERCIILFDEFEKTYSKDDSQNSVLSLFDGTYQSNKLFVLTVNHVYRVSEFVLNRPGRVYYHLRYSGIEEEFIREYCEYHLDNKSLVEDFITLSKAIGKFNFDILQALVQEVNIHEESPLQCYKLMNIDIDESNSSWACTLVDTNTGKSQEEIKRQSFNNSFDIYWEGSENEEEHEWKYFTKKELVKYDALTSSFIFEDDGFKLIVKRLPNEQFSLAF